MAKNNKIDMSSNRYHVPLKKHEQDRVRKMKDELGKSYGSMFNYTTKDSWPADVCMDVYRLTDGEITATRMRPDLFANLPAVIKLAERVVKDLKPGTPKQLEDTCMFIMNCIQELDSVVYDDLIDQLSCTEMGKRVVDLRSAQSKFKAQ